MNDKYSYAEAFEMFAFNEDVAECMCHGSGWALSDRDSWHRCPYHHTKDSKHPEDDGGCPECGDGANYPPDKCSLCGMHIQEQRWNDEPQSHITPDEPKPGLSDEEIPF